MINQQVIKLKWYFAPLLLLLLNCNQSETTPAPTGLVPDDSFDLDLDIPPRIIIKGQSPEGNALKIDFELTDADSETANIAVYAWHKMEQRYVDVSIDASGDAGSSVSVGSSKSLSWPLDRLQYEHLRIEATNDLPPTLSDLVAAVSSDRIRGDIEAMDGVRHYNAGKALLDQTREYIADLFEKRGLTVVKHDFTFRSAGHQNVIGTHAGTAQPEAHLQISGHFDTIGGTPGADDNASGTAGMLEAMRILSLFEHEKTIDFLAFDLEESGLIGSKRYVSEIGRNLDIEGLINFEMIGYTCRSAECAHKQLADTSIYNIAPPASAPLQAAFYNIAAEYVPELKVTQVVSDNSADFRRSDHVAFWDNGFQALFLTDGANFRNPHYHQGSDTPGTIDYHFVTNIVKTTVATIARLAGWRDRGVAKVTFD